MVLKRLLAPLLLLFSCLAGCASKSPPDEAMAAGKTVDNFTPSTADYFAQMDGLADPESGIFRELSLDKKAIMGRNAWMLWTGGNEAFWDWLARHGYGTLDFLQLLDSQQRATRFARAGLISEPTMRPPSEQETKVAHGIRYDRPIDPKVPQPDSKVYGFSSGIVGLRLFPNPEFQGEVAALWDSERYYKDPDYAANPQTIRPFRVGMSCAFCHAGPHPLNPPADPAAPKWENLSGTIGNQYMRANAIFGNRLSRDNFLYQALSAQLPGTIDTSLIAADNINNASTMNAIFDLPQRVTRSLNNPREVIGHEVEGYPGIGKGPDMEIWNTNPRPVPRVLADGSDSVGVYVALARVYLNIGTYHQQWIRLHNPVLGIRKQQPFKLTDCEKNSVYWSATKLRVEPIVAFFQEGTAPMRLKDAPDGKAKGNLRGAGVPWDPAYAAGRKVFARGCIACHSSIQPGDNDAVESEIALHGFQGPRVELRLTTDDLWRLTQGDSELPAAYADWAAAAVEQREFWEQNFLSTDMRVPVTMMKTNSARAVGTNAMRGHVWNDFSSKTYKELESVGQISFRDPFSGSKKKFAAPPGGPGYYRPHSLISLWATAPFLHNNSVGQFNCDPSVDGRLRAFDDAIHKLMWPDRRGQQSESATREQLEKDGGLIWRTDEESSLVFHGYQIPDLVAGITGWSPWALGILPWLPSILFALIGGLLFIPDDRLSTLVALRPKWLRLLGRKIAPLVAIFLLATSIVELCLSWHWAASLQVVEVASNWRLPYLRLEAFLFPLVPFALGMLLFRHFWKWTTFRFAAPGLGALCLLAAFVFAAGWGQSLSGRGDDVVLGPFPAGTPVNVLANMDHHAPILARIQATRALLEYFGTWQRAPKNNKPGLKEFEKNVAPPLMAVSQCPDFVMDRGHDFEFMQAWSDEEKEALIALLKTF